MKRCVLSVILLLSAAPLGAQKPNDNQQQAAVATIAAVGQHVATDGAWYNAGSVIVGGWAFECANTDVTIEVVLDGAVLDLPPMAFMRVAREDVWLWAYNGGVCANPLTDVPYYSGVNAMFDASALASGPHTVQFRLRNANGVMTEASAGQSVKSATFIKP